MDTLRIGFCRECITPPVGVRLYGYPNNRKSESVHDDLYVNAIAFLQGTVRALMISVDVCALTTAQVNAFRKAINALTAVPEDHILIAATHTHSGPTTRTTFGWGSADDSYLKDILLPAMLAATEQAVSNVTPAVMGIGLTHSNAGVNRRQHVDGKVKLGQNPDGPFDPKMYLLSFATAEGKPIVNLIHYGAHPTACGPGPEITRDWPGIMTDTVETETGIPTVFFNGAEGDVGPRISNGKTIGDMHYVEEIGFVAGRDALRAWDAVQPVPEPLLAVHTEDICLPYDPFPSKEETEKVLAALNGASRIMDQVEKHRCEEILAFYESGKEPLTHWRFRQTVLCLGPVAFVPYPFEMFCEIAMDQQAGSPFPYTLCLSNCGGTELYLPTREEFPFGGYEVQQFKYSKVFVLTEDAECRIVAENQRLLAQLFSKRRR